MVRSYLRKRDDISRRDRAAIVVRLHREGWSNRQIARRLRVSDSTVRADLRGASPDSVSPATRLRRGWQARAETLRASGHPEHPNSQLMPYWMIADRLGIGEEVIRRYFTRWQRRSARAAEAARLRSAGLSTRQIAGRLGVSEATARRDLSRAKVRHLPARKVPPDLLSGAQTAHPDDAPPNLIPIRRIS